MIFWLLILWRARRMIARLATAGLLLLALAHPPAPASPPAGGLGQATQTVGCRERQGLPDPRCTPGAIRAGVALARICTYGYTRSVRPPESYTELLKLRQMRAYGLAGPASDYEEDHLVPLSLGGAPRDPANLWPQPRHGAFNAEQKDHLETWVARMACAGRMPLSALQKQIATNWVALYQRAGGSRVLEHYPAGG
jgi:hypothetical protein